MDSGSYQHNGERVQLDVNAHNGTALLNGGDQGWGRQTWDVAVHTDDSITFLLFDRMGNGFPGIFAACLTHTVTPNEWRVAFGVTPLIHPAPLDLSQTVFFNLDGLKSNAAGEDNTVLNHTLFLPAAGMRFGVDDRGVPTGDVLANHKDRQFDFWSSSQRTIGSGLRQRLGLQQNCSTSGGRGCGYDDTYLLAHGEKGGHDEVPVAVLSSARSGITMELFADRDALHVHTWNERTGKSVTLLSSERVDMTAKSLSFRLMAPYVGALMLKEKSQGSGPVPQYGAISLEMRDWPDAVNQPQWQRKRSIIGMEGLYTSFATYRFSVQP
jgi:aldose 1-epimerase